MGRILIGNIKGPQGIQGPQGERGIQGPAGPVGPQGEKGDTGAQGPKGEKGATGSQGPAGPMPTLTENLLATVPGTALDATMGKQLKDELDSQNISFAKSIGDLSTSLGGVRIFTSLSALNINYATMTYSDFVSNMVIGNILICYVSNNTASFLPFQSSYDYALTVECVGATNSSKRLTFEAVMMSGSADGIYRARYSSAAGTKWTGWKRIETTAV